MRAAALEKQAAEAKERAAKLELELAKLKQPRVFTDDQRARFTAAMNPFAGTKFAAAILPGDPEFTVFMGHITSALEAAGWKWVDWALPGGPFTQIYSLADKPNIGQFGAFGVTVLLWPDHATELTPAAAAVVTALQAGGFEASLEVVSNPSIQNKDAVNITIGKKR